MKTTDRLIAASRGSADAALAYAARWYGPNGDKDITDYVREVFRVAPLVGVDPAIVIAQSVHETSDAATGRPWASHWWRTRLNPAGMGVTGDPAENEASPRFPNGAAAARAQISHLLVYALGPADAGSLWYRTMNVAIPADDPRYEAYLAAYGNVARAKTLAQLAGTWAVDPDYHTKIAAVGNRVFPGIEDQRTGGTMPLTIDVDLVNRGFGKLRDRDATITVHNNGNPNSDRFDEQRFVANGGGSSGVAYHFAVDAGGAIQIMTLDTRGVHAGHTEGNATSIAIEMCVGSEPWATVKENTAQLLAAIVTRDKRLKFGNGMHEFSLDRIREHRDWPGANPACPQRLIQTDGGVEKIVVRARAIVAAMEPPEPEPIWPSEPIPAPDGFLAQGHPLVPLDAKRQKCIHGTTLRTAPNRDAPPIGMFAKVSRGRTRTFDYAAEVSGEMWLVSRRGSWGLASAFEAA